MTGLTGNRSGTAAPVAVPPSPPTDYTELARLGRTSRAAYLAGFGVILGSWLGLVAALLIARPSPTALAERNNAA